MGNERAQKEACGNGKYFKVCKQSMIERQRGGQLIKGS